MVFSFTHIALTAAITTVVALPAAVNVITI